MVNAILERNLPADANSAEVAKMWQSACATAGKIAHDFRNFFNIVLGFTSLSTELVGPSSQVAQYLREIDGGCVQGRGYLDQLSVLACCETPGRGSCSVREVIHEEVRRFRAKVSRKVVFADRLDDSTVSAAIDSSSLSICLQQLLTNAGEATRLNDTIRVASGTVVRTDAEPHDPLMFGRLSAGTYERISICDSGGGIAESILPNLLRKSFVSEKRHHPGIGLGIVFLKLWYCGGGLRLESKPGSETRVEMFLPLCTVPVGPNIPSR